MATLVYCIYNRIDLLTSITPNNRSIQADRLVQIDFSLGQYKMKQQIPIPPPPSHFPILKLGD